MERTRISSPQSAHEARAARGAKGSAAQEAGQAGAPGEAFAQLLAGLGGGDGALVDMAGMAGDAAPSLASIPDAAALVAWAGGLQPGAALAPGMDGVMGGEADALMNRVGLGLLRQGRDSLVGQTASLDGAAEAAALNGVPQGPGGRAQAGRALPLGQAAAASDAAGAHGGHATGAAGARSGAMAPQQDAVSPTPIAQAAVPGAALAGRGDAVPAPVPTAAGMDQPVPAAWAGAMTAAAGGGTAPGAPARADSAVAGTGDVLGVQGGEQASEAREAGAITPDAAQAGMAGADDAPAEQVSYWVHQKTQNAELTLEQGGRPVEVRVALTGEQAHVTLRSDQAEARALLDAGRDQLQDMLQRQGLQLAGMTVGTSAGGDAQARQDGRAPGRPGAQRASVQAAPVAGPAQRGPGARGVDIFV